MSDHAATHFAVFTTQRNGSTWLMSVLNGLENVTAHGELFLRRRRSPERRWDSDFAYPYYVESTAQHGRLRPFSVFRYLNALYGAGGSVGFKLMYSQVRDYPEIVPYLMRKHIRVVHLIRRNHLDVLISFAIKREIGKAHLLADEDRPKELHVELDTQSLVKEVRRLQFKHDVGRRLLRASRLRHIEVAYEDLVQDQRHFERVLEFLRLPAENGLPESNIFKTRLGRQADVIKNYDDVRAVLLASEYATLLDS
jgi:LPS sulfotransferase NodH